MKRIDSILTVLLVLFLLWIIGGGLFLILKKPSESTSLINERSMTKVSIPNPVVNLGMVSSGDLVSAMFFIYNIGRDTLFIEHVQPDCSCTNYYLGADVLLPKDSTSLVINVSTEGKIGAQSINTVVSTNTEERFHIIKILFDVAGTEAIDVNQVSFVVDTINVGYVLLGKEYTIKQYMRNETSEDILLMGTSTSSRCMELSKYPNVVCPGISDPIEILFKPDVIGEIERRITLEIMKDQKVQHLSFLVVGRCVDT